MHGGSRPALAGRRLRPEREPRRRDRPLPSPAVRRWGHLGRRPEDSMGHRTLEGMKREGAERGREFGGREGGAARPLRE